MWPLGGKLKMPFVSVLINLVYFTVQVMPFFITLAPIVQTTDSDFIRWIALSTF